MKDASTNASRRDFLKFAGTAVPAAATALVVGADTAEAAESVPTEGLRKTEHVRKYLQTARF